VQPASFESPSEGNPARRREHDEQFCRRGHNLYQLERGNGLTCCLRATIARGQE
jgi:hypothetical protein